MNKRILLVGGGTGGHIFPLHPLIRELNQNNAQVHVLTSDSQLDQDIIDRNFSDCVMTHHIISTGKIRAYVSFRNFIDFFRILRGITQARKLLKKIDPEVIFFKGGFVGFPILMALKIRKFTQSLQLLIPSFLRKHKHLSLPRIFLHESDSSVGNLSKIFFSYADQIFLSYPAEKYTELQSEITKEKLCPDTPLFWHDPKISSETQPPEHPLPQIIIFGGSQGAQWINRQVAQCHEQLTQKYRIILVTGKGKSEPIPASIQQHEFLDQPNLYQEIAQSDLVITRAGSSIFQVFHLQKPALLIPLPGSAREHQLHNAEYFCKDQRICHYLEQSECSDEIFLGEIEKTLSDSVMTETLKQQNIRSGEQKIVERMLD